MPAHLTDDKAASASAQNRNGSDRLRIAANDVVNLSTPSFSEWLTQQNGSRLRITTADDIAPMEALIASVSYVEVHFLDSNDGRGFTLGRRLRDMGFTGELRATGAYAEDQLQYLYRCGFDSFHLPPAVDKETASELLRAISVTLQPSTISERQVILSER